SGPRPAPRRGTLLFDCALPDSLLAWLTRSTPVSRGGDRQTLRRRITMSPRKARKVEPAAEAAPETANDSATEFGFGANEQPPAGEPANAAPDTATTPEEVRGGDAPPIDLSKPAPSRGPGRGWTERTTQGVSYRRSELKNEKGVPQI